VQPVPFAIVGGGWRTSFFLKVVKAMPQCFSLVGVVLRERGKAKALEAAWAVSTFPDVDTLLRLARPEFVVVAVARPAAPPIIRELASRNMPVLAETPPAPNLEGLLELWQLVQAGARIQVAEQYTFQPLHAARLAAIRSGLLGEPSFAQVSCCHGYHGVSLIRRFLGIGTENATVTGRAFEADLIAGPDRRGPPVSERLVKSRQVIAQLDFAGKLGIYDFTSDQYFSWIRSLSVLVRGSRGELRDQAVRALKDFETPVEMLLLRQDSGENGNLEGLWHRGILLGDHWIYRNPFPYAALSDDEIAIATVLRAMHAYLETGAPVYDFAEAAQDHYLALCIDQAVETGAAVHTVAQPWASYQS